MGRYRRLADGDVHCAGSATYQKVLGYRSRTRTLNPHPNPITDPNPKINKNDTGMKLSIELYLKVDFPGTGVGSFIKGLLWVHKRPTV